MRIYVLFFAVAIATFTACNVSESEVAVNEKAFFDLAGFIDAQVEELNREKPRLEKTVTINGTEETQTNPELDFERDLAIFRRSDINKSAWTEKYRIDQTDGETAYIAIDSTMQTQLLRVTTGENGAVSSVYVERRMGNFISDSRQQMTYQPGKGYTVVSKQSSELVGDVSVDLNVAFRK